MDIFVESFRKLFSFESHNVIRDVIVFHNCKINKQFLLCVNENIPNSTFMIKSNTGCMTIYKIGDTIPQISVQLCFYFEEKGGEDIGTVLF